MSFDTIRYEVDAGIAFAALQPGLCARGIEQRLDQLLQTGLIQYRQGQPLQPAIDAQQRRFADRQVQIGGLLIEQGLQQGVHHHN